MVRTNAVLATVLALAVPWTASKAQTTPDRYHQKLQPVLEKLIHEQEKK
jgi:hypothetical protein